MTLDGATRLEEVGPAHEVAYLDMVADFERAGEGYGWNDVETARVDFATFVRDLAREARGEGLPPGICAQTTYILLHADGRALGEIRFRPEPGDDLEALMAANGHLGYNVRPSARNHGHATRMLALALERARAAGLARVMLPVRDDNLASARVVERNGGQLERRAVDQESGDLMRVYWIALA
ncbi:MAG TPA: GNAT family N-acetyltransferase [Ktedonobacterales bacterium]|nr:GNAT family N-acetyltransferase [Ktedonobacterales bacterium]